MSTPTNETAPGIASAEGNSPANDGNMLPGGWEMEQATLFPQLGMPEPSPLEGILAEHEASENPDKQAYMAACRQAFMDELRKGPCSMAEARLRHGLHPGEVEGRAAGAVVAQLSKAGIIRHVDYDKSPWKHCHNADSKRWALVKGVPA